jgi:tetratricopeptide (TPR) repeat protein
VKRLTGFLMAIAVAAQPADSPGFDHFYNLEYEQAIAAFEKEIREAPADPNGYNHLAQGLLFREMLRAGALESELVTGANPFLRRDKLEPPVAVQQRFLWAIAQAKEKAQARLDRDARDFRARYAMCVAYGFQGNWGFLVTKEYLSALQALTISRKLCNQVVEQNPAFVDARLVEGLHDYVVGSLPLYMRAIGFLAGFRGDKEGGIRTLREVAAKGTHNRTDAKVILGVIYRRERRPDDAIPLVEDLIRRYPRNYLFRLELGQMWADSGDGAKALAAIDAVDQLHRAGITGYGTLSAAKIDFARGVIQFWYNDLDQAERNLSRAAKQADALDLHTGTMAWLRLGQTYDLKNQRDRAIGAYRQVLTLAPSSDMAKESRRYLHSPYRREAKG